MTVKRRAGHCFEAVNRCIYCGAADKWLTKEHIVPLGLGGNLILPKSSCTDCAKITHAFEYTTLRTTLGILRMRLDFPTRRKKERPTHIKIKTRIGAEIDVPVEEYPVGAAIPNFARAGIFDGRAADTPLIHVGKKIYLNGDLANFINKYGWDGVYAFKWMPYEFAQTVVKICYSYAVAVLGMNSFEPICLDYILKDNSRIGYVFGQSGDNLEAEKQSKEIDSQVYKLDVGVRVSEQNEPIVVVYFSFIPDGGTPIYEVAVGRVQSRENIAFLTEKVRNDGYEIVPAPFV